MDAIICQVVKSSRYVHNIFTSAGKSRTRECGDDDQGGERGKLARFIVISERGKEPDRGKVQ